MAEEILDKTIQSRIINFIKKNSKNLIILSTLSIIILFSYFIYIDLKKKNEIKISEQYTQAYIHFKEKKIDNAKQLLENIINKKHKFYSPLALSFIVDNNIETDTLKTINFFDKVLSIGSINKENLNLIKIKKAIFLFNLEDEELIIKTLNPIINSDSVWRKIAIRLLSDYFLSQNQKIKANEYIQLLSDKKKK